MKDKINELIAIEVMGWRVHDSSTGTYLDEHSEVIAFNPFENYQHAFWALRRLHELGYQWKIVPNEKGRAYVEVADGEGNYLCHSNTHKPIHSICFAVLNVMGLTVQVN